MSHRSLNLQARLDALVDAGAHRIVASVDTVLAEGVRCGASDVHFEPTLAALEINFRIDGVMRAVAFLPRDLTPNVIARLKVMSDLLTYRIDIPQEGALRAEASKRVPDMRVSTFPTVHGEKAVVRVFHRMNKLLGLDELGLPNDIRSSLERMLLERSGAIFLTGPSGSGKTTTIYACLRRLAHDGVGRHIVTIEDPVEQLVDGVSQSQVRPGTEFDFARGLRSILRQDPDVIMVGEIRDRETASVAIEAALTGHLVFSTLHAGSSAGVVGRLLEMGVEPYLLTSAIKGILNQRLLRRSCASCGSDDASLGALPHCERCLGTGYHGRFLIAELLIPDMAFRRAVLDQCDTDGLTEAAMKSGLRPIRAAADEFVAQAQTSRSEVERVLGPI